MKKHPFTLVELLLVICVAGILLSMTLPAFSRMTAGRQTDRAASQVAANLSLARTLAVTQNTHTAVVFPLLTEISGYEYGNAACRVAFLYKTVTNAGNTTYTFAKWAPDEAWEIFSPGVVIPAGATNFGVQNEGEMESSTTVTSPVLNVDCSSILSTASSVRLARAVIFAPNGQLVMPSGDEVKKFVIRFAEGVKIPGMTTITLTENPDDTQSYSVLLVNSLTGRTEIEHVTE